MNQTSGWAIEADHMHFVYDDGIEALKEVSFKVKKGSCVGLIGANGAGKSTCVQLIFGLLKVKSGALNVFGLPVEKHNHIEIRRRAGLLFQNPDDMFFTNNLLEDVTFGLSNQGFSREQAQDVAMETLSELGIAHLAKRAPYRLSGGEKHLAALATILSMKPELLVLDEPTAGLDPRARKRMISIIKNQKATRLIVSHDLDMILDMCDEVILLSEGQVVAMGSADAILHDQECLERYGLELPLGVAKR